MIQNSITWSSPANIALIKYWGKKGIQQPINPSLSFTLSRAKTLTQVSWSSDKPSVDFLFEGKNKDEFLPKIHQLLKGNENLSQLNLKIQSENTFPHSTGIASSASAMSALALCLCSIEKNSIQSQQDFLQEASALARKGSGSACRSLYSTAALWGKCAIKNSSDNYAIPVDNIAPIFHTYRDSILIVSTQPKVLPSSQGHQLMNNHPFKQARLKSANNNLEKLLEALQSGDLEKFSQIVISEAWQLHAMLLTSTPSIKLLEGNTLEIVKKVERFAKKQNIPLSYTFDAGPNVHLLYPEKYSSCVVDFIKKELLPLTSNNLWIDDYVGNGPERLQ